MKRVFIMLAVLLATMGATAQSERNYTRNGNTFAAVKAPRNTDVRAHADSTTYEWADGSIVRRIWIARTGSCFVIRTSNKTGNEYRKYLPREVSAQICKELGREYKPQNRK